MSEEQPFADGRNLLWLLSGFGADDRLRASVPLNRQQYLRIRPLLREHCDVRDDDWLTGGEYQILPALREPLRATLAAAAADGSADDGSAVDVEFEPDLVYFLGARQDLPDGSAAPPPGAL
ncbi:hypothetical protein OG455_02005 [Kitasatospora sp. NBC_01287]|uniref:hypothetical protein n=1 Tax=Kitasatospora sp. NBC_01287 TaxID=2903573 RepID=UPI002259B2C6|nr:hypothetical protein [Kitasatospora sp. NBC_01287]MCX4744298.1 hypothetical protein [Kitasatospora sp. NBC_01287]